jgi:DnaJ-class molecular chaperone
MAVTKTTKCPRCFGAGRDAAGKTCSQCKGTGEVTLKPGDRASTKVPTRRDAQNGLPPYIQQR